MDLGWQLATLPYGDTWRRGRKLLHAHVHPGATPKYNSVLVHAARRFARDILSAKQDDDILPYVIHANVGQTIVKVVYGIDVTDTDSEYITLPERVVDYMNEAVSPGRFLVEFFPICEYPLRSSLTDLAYEVRQ
jgi:cytochrome P450